MLFRPSKFYAIEENVFMSILSAVVNLKLEITMPHVGVVVYMDMDTFNGAYHDKVVMGFLV